MYGFSEGSLGLKSREDLEFKFFLSLDKGIILPTWDRAKVELWGTKVAYHLHQTGAVKRTQGPESGKQDGFTLPL